MHTRFRVGSELVSQFLLLQLFPGTSQHARGSAAQNNESAAYVTCSDQMELRAVGVAFCGSICQRQSFFCKSSAQRLSRTQAHTLFACTREPVKFVLAPMFTVLPAAR